MGYQKTFSSINDNAPDKFFQHIGVKYRSGRYPYGSGEDPFQHDPGHWLNSVNKLKAEGFSELERAQAFGYNTTTELRAAIARASNDQTRSNIARARSLYDKGLRSATAIAKEMGTNESNVRYWLKDESEARANALNNTCDVLKKEVADNKYIMVGAGVERYLGISRTKLNTAVQMLEDEGYVKRDLWVEQLGGDGEKKTHVEVLVKDDSISTHDLYEHMDEIKIPNDYKTKDGGKTFTPKQKIQNISSDRIYINYAEDGGTEKDGTIELRKGVDDLDLGDAKYAQVRIAVDGKYYAKGVALYSNDVPKGYDIMINSNKSKEGGLEKALKKQKDDPSDPFGASITESKGALNIVNEEGDWGDWSKNLPSQFLAKQPTALAKKQLALAYDEKVEEFDRIKSINNPALKKYELEAFADDCDGAAVHLKAAPVSRQATHVILPINSLKAPNDVKGIKGEIYAPNYENGEEVALVRFPHGGIFEIPKLIVNNKNKEAREKIGNDAKDAVGINYKVAEQLSGADFDGDTVLVIPTKNFKVQNKSALEGLKDFNPTERYEIPESKIYNAKTNPKGIKVMSESYKQKQMGVVSNLITDMTIKGATDDELARAVRHSMVVIDAVKHKLDYKQSYIDNRIAELQEEYQGKKSGGASTLISKAKSQQDVNERRIYSYSNKSIDPDTGEKIYSYTGKTKTKRVEVKSESDMTAKELEYHRKTGKKIYRDTDEKIVVKQKSTKMAETKDANTLSSGTAIEAIYAAHANKMKALGNEARKEWLKVEDTPVNKEAKETYKTEVDSLKSKLNNSLKNSPRERRAQLIGNVRAKEKIKGSAEQMSKDDIKKIKAKELLKAREEVGASKYKIEITKNEWDAMQSGALSTNLQKKILDNADKEKLVEWSTPSSNKAMTPAKVARAKALLNNGCTQAEVAEVLGVSTTTIRKYAM